MPELGFEIEAARPAADAALPLVTLTLAVRSSAPIDTASLRCQVRIEPALRTYAAGESKALARVLGPADHPAHAQPLLWTHVALNLPGFAERTTAELLLPCPLDLRTGPATYLAALEGGVIPITLLFGGTLFYREREALRVGLVPSTAEARFALPVEVCRAALAKHHGDASAVPVRRDVLARLERYRATRALAGVDDAIAALLDGAGSA